MSWRQARLDFAPDHPTAAGHFPGNPMIPGAVMLDAVIQAIGGTGCDQAMVVKSAKFLHVVRPGDVLELRWRQEGGGVIFEAMLKDALAVTGRIGMGA